MNKLRCADVGSSALLDRGVRVVSSTIIVLLRLKNDWFIYIDGFIVCYLNVESFVTIRISHTHKRNSFLTLS